MKENNPQITSDQPSSKRKGNDGYYFECEVCDLGGELLCCDNCPRTYHLECLNTALECVPEGRWECPICSANDECTNEQYQPSEDESMDDVDKTTMSNMNEESSQEASLEKNSPNLSLEASTSSVATKRKNNVGSHNSAKKRKTNKEDKSDSNMCRKGLSKVREGTSKSHGKHKMVLEEADSEPMMFDDNAPDDKQVDKVVGCRSSETNLKNHIHEDKLHVYRRLTSRERKESYMDSLMKDIEGSGSMSLNNKNLQDDIISCSNSAAKTVSYEFLVKWVGKSHIHNSWVLESELKVLAKRKLENYKAKYGTATMNLCEEKWKIPQRVIATRNGSSTEVYVKWTGLPYDECTWERIDEPTIAKSLDHLVDLFFLFERQTLEKNDVRKKGKKVIALSEQPKDLAGGSLFPHQLEALNWLRKCWHKSRNIILADEMGLGKTVSACAFISSLYNEFEATRPCLVLVPLSTMPNWMSEFALWAPHLNVVEYHGNARARALIRQYEWHACCDGSKKKSSAYKFNVLLTTYEMVLCDSSYLRGVPWEVLVVDEGHRLKNSNSKLFGLLNTFSFQHRVLLTGTPLQNNIGEMYNLLNFLQSASFPSLSSFEEQFNDLTTAAKVEELKKLVAPHMLRRLKKDVMQNIPPKIERVVPVELSSIQAEYYRAMLTKNYQILRNIRNGVPQQSMLNIVMQLRKVCNHPYLIPGTEPESGSVEFLHEMRIKASAKLTLLHSMLKVLQKDGHRVLIFSQMTNLLDILEDYLEIEFGPESYERVDGSICVTKRQASIARFNKDKNRFVFLLSTRACGLGINLASADTVIIYDSDFNPHADIQAMNRAHRIGQSKRLLVYRFVVRASVEERILQLAKKKMMLDQLFVHKSGSQKEVEDILKWGTEQLFGDQNSKDEALTETEPNNSSRRRNGGLGDVYEDTCADGTNNILWDENAILKLLDRTNLHSSSPDIVEEDMLGSVKSLEWNEEEQAEMMSVPLATNGTTSAQTSEEENEWDRLLRVRWEKYQTEEEEALGRGKRQRKSVTYLEAYVALPLYEEALSESDEEKEPPPEPKPERKYTPAVHAIKEKYAKLRARQKERLANKKASESSSSGQQIPRSVDRYLPLTHNDLNLFPSLSMGSRAAAEMYGTARGLDLNFPPSYQPLFPESHTGPRAAAETCGTARGLDLNFPPSDQPLFPESHMGFRAAAEMYGIARGLDLNFPPSYQPLFRESHTEVLERIIQRSRSGLD